MSPVRGNASKLVRDVSAGGVIVRWVGNELEVVLVGQERPERWTIPKGTPLLGETIEQAAIREVGEETGLRVRIIEPLGEITYWFVVRGARHHKMVHFFLLEATGGDTADHDWEHDYVDWVPAAEALRRVSFPNEAGVLELAIEAARATGAPEFPGSGRDEAAQPPIS